MFCAMCQDTRQKTGFTRGSRNYQATAVFEHSISQAHTKAAASVANQPSMKGHFDAACAKENDCILAQLPFFFRRGEGGGGSLPILIVVLAGFVHCLACWPPTLTPPYQKSEILARLLVLISFKLGTIIDIAGLCILIPV